MKKKTGKIKIREIKRQRVRKIKREIIELKKEETLEEHVEDSEIFESAELPQFVSPSIPVSSSPVLEKIQREEETDLEGNIISTPLSRATPTQDVPAMNYSASSNYFSSSYNESSNYSSEPSAIPVAERERVGERIQRQDLLDWKDIQAGTRETSWNMEQGRINLQNVEEDRKELPFEKREKKYKEFRG